MSMITQSIVYHEFMETLKTQAIKTDKLPFRDKIRKMMLGYSLRILNFSSVWMSYYDENTQQFIVANSSKKLVNSMESINVQREVYSPEISKHLITKLQNTAPKPFIFYTKNLQPDDRIYEIYGDYNSAVMFMTFYSQNELWGILEMWDSLQPGRIIGEMEEDIMSVFAAQLSETLLTPEG